uniref:Uncharacterized protein n=1 Tax=Clandestinovirus TaxID=2831644 RepID=A0A8F8PQV1_9VIRU|nr:hypothetical protein KOM_12_205 [Clandestinovirus]
MITEQPYTTGLPPAPRVSVISDESKGCKKMQPGRYYFSMIMDVSTDVDQAYLTMAPGRSGIDSMSPITSIDIPSEWNGFQISNIPLSRARPMALVMMSKDGNDFYQVGVAPAVPRPIAWNDPMIASGSFDDNTGLYTLTILHPQSRLNGDIVGQMVYRKTEDANQNYELTSLDQFFEPTVPGLTGLPEIRKPDPKPTEIRDVNKTVRAIPYVNTGESFGWPNGMVKVSADSDIGRTNQQQSSDSGYGVTPATAVMVMSGLLVGYLAVVMTR